MRSALLQRNHGKRKPRGVEAIRPMVKVLVEAKSGSLEVVNRTNGFVTFTAADGTVTVIPDLPDDLAEVTALLSAETL